MCFSQSTEPKEISFEISVFAKDWFIHQIGITHFCCKENPSLTGQPTLIRLYGRMKALRRARPLYMANCRLTSFQINVIKGPVTSHRMVFMVRLSPIQEHYILMVQALSHWDRFGQDFIPTLQMIEWVFQETDLSQLLNPGTLILSHFLTTSLMRGKDFYVAQGKETKRLQKATAPICKMTVKLKRKPSVFTMYISPNHYKFN